MQTKSTADIRHVRCSELQGTQKFVHTRHTYLLCLACSHTGVVFSTAAHCYVTCFYTARVFILPATKRKQIITVRVPRVANTIASRSVPPTLLTLGSEIITMPVISTISIDIHQTHKHTHTPLPTIVLCLTTLLLVSLRKIV